MNYSLEIPPPTVIVKVNSSASNHYFSLQDLWVLEEAENYYDGTELLLPNTSTLKETMKAQLSLGDSVSIKAK